jgi:hypothetical protein
LPFQVKFVAQVPFAAAMDSRVSVPSKHEYETKIDRLPFSGAVPKNEKAFLDPVTPCPIFHKVPMTYVLPSYSSDEGTGQSLPHWLPFHEYPPLHTNRHSSVLGSTL